MKASERRALDNALKSERCPNCNHMGLTPDLCLSCGQGLLVEADFAERPVPGGFKVVAEVRKVERVW